MTPGTQLSLPPKSASIAIPSRTTTLSSKKNVSSHREEHHSVGSKKALVQEIADKVLQNIEGSFPVITSADIQYCSNNTRCTILYSLVLSTINEMNPKNSSQNLMQNLIISYILDNETAVYAKKAVKMLKKVQGSNSSQEESRDTTVHPLFNRVLVQVQKEEIQNRWLQRQKKEYQNMIIEDVVHYCLSEI